VPSNLKANTWQLLSYQRLNLEFKNEVSSNCNPRNKYNGKCTPMEEWIIQDKKRMDNAIP
jgi:hypothetical protein